jgi:hypothetical protein
MQLIKFENIEPLRSFELADQFQKHKLENCVTKRASC